MKKLMKKKVSLFGKEFSVFALVAVAMVTLASAALVPYLSNMVTGTVTAESPMKQEISLTEGNWQTNALSLGTMHGGGEKTLYVRTENLANKSITGNVTNLVTNPNGVTCADFISVNVSTNNGTVYDLIALSSCTEPNANTVKFAYAPEPNTWNAFQVDINKIVVTFKVNAVGTYNFTSQIIPEVLP